MLNSLTWVWLGTGRFHLRNKNSSKTKLWWLFLESVCRWFKCWRSKHASVLLFGAHNQCQVSDLDQGICTCWPIPVAEKEGRIAWKYNVPPCSFLERGRDYLNAKNPGLECQLLYSFPPAICSWQIRKCVCPVSLFVKWPVPTQTIHFIALKSNILY